jgi:hypothetical protein
MNEPAKTFPTPTHFDELYPGLYLKAGEFKGKKPTLTIASVKLDELEGLTGKKVKGCVGFERTSKQLVLNKTNGLCLKAMFGNKPQEWIGHKVTLYAGTWNAEECIRVWGSPEVAADFELKIELPRKRPFNMTMHKVVQPTGVPANDPSEQQE